MTETYKPVVFLSDADVDRILRHLYLGERPQRIKFFICSCGAFASLHSGDAAAIGWQILPHVLCPRCRHKPYTGPARERYLADVDRYLALVHTLAPGKDD